MEFLNEKPDVVEIHVKMTRAELDNFIHDFEHDYAESDWYTVTKLFIDYLKGL